MASSADAYDVGFSNSGECAPSDRSAALVRLECARLLWSQAIRSIALVPPVAVLLLVVMAPHVSTARLFSWGLLMALTTLVGLSAAITFRRSDVGPEAASHWTRARVLTALLHGSCWGSAALLIMPGPEHRDLRLVVMLFLVAVLASQSIAYAGSTTAFVAGAVPLIVPTTVVLIATGDRFHVALGIGAMVYLGMMFAHNRELHHALVGNIRLRFEHAALADHLGELNLAGEEANRELRAVNTEVEALAHRDELTGALNRRALMSQLRAAAERIDREGGELCFVMIDLDHFKTVNDEHGHMAGDALLRGLAAKLAAQVRPSDMFARYGGEEFVMTFTNIPHDDVRASIERIRLIAEGTTVRHNGVALGCTVSIGAAPYESGGSIETLFEEADAALYRAKAEGRNRAAFARDQATLGAARATAPAP